ncbi:MAG: S8 family serine peptidase [Salinibacter sp.]
MTQHVPLVRAVLSEFRFRDSGRFGAKGRGPRLAGWLFVLGLCVGLPAAHAAPEARDSSATAQKYWIFLADRPGASSDSLQARWNQPVSSTYLDRLQALGVEPLVRSQWFHAVSARLSPAIRRTVRSLPFVRRTQPVATLHSARTGISSSAPRDQTGTIVSHQAGSSASAPPKYGAARSRLSRINALPPLNRGLSGHGVRVGFLDAHFRGLHHPAFATLRSDDRLAALRNFTENRQGGSHGMGVASVAAGYDPGTLVGPAYGATLLGATTEYTQFERNVEEDNFVAGLEWLYRRGADVVNVSIGYTTFDEGQHSYTPEDLDGDTAITTRAVDRAAQLGVTVVVSAGNSGCASPDSCWYYVNTPADADSAIAVGGITPDSSLAPFSARGPTADGRRKPDVLVQATKVSAAWGDGRYARLQGTSFASPQVTGIVAQMLQVNPALRPMQVRRLLRQTASQAHAPDTTRGWGIVNADAAIRIAEWRARTTPPSALQVSAPYRPVSSSSLVVPVAAPPHTSTLRIALHTPLGRRVRRIKRAAHPGPNRLRVDAQSLPPGRYRVVVTTDAGDRATGRVTITE